MNFIIGGTKTGEVVFCEVNSYGERRSVTFAETSIVSWDDFDLYEYYADFVDEMKSDGNWLWDMCMNFQCAPYELAEYLADDVVDPIDFLSCSVYPEAIELDSDGWGTGEYYLQDSAFGRIAYNMEDFVSILNYDDAKFAIERFSNKLAYKDVITDEEFDKLTEACNRYSEDEMHQWIKAYIDNYTNGEL